MQAAAIAVCAAITLVALALVARAAAHLVRVVRLGAPAPGRSRQPVARALTLVREVLGHTRMLRWGLVGAAHWFVMVGFGLLLLTLLTAYVQLVDPEFRLPGLGNRWPYQLMVETVAVLTGLGILTLIAIRQAGHPRRLGRRSRFAGSTAWQAYYVEGTIVGVVACVLLLRGLEGALHGVRSWGLDHAWSYPLVAAFSGLPPATLRGAIVAVATIKIVISMAWFAVIALNVTMGVAWHRFTAFPNIFFRREPDGRSALGAAKPLTVHGQPVDLAALEDLDEDAALGAGRVQDFSWKAILDFTTCTECGRCQSQCPAWATGKPLSPKLLVMGLREHAYGAAPFLLAERPEEAPEAARAEAQRPLVAPAAAGGVVDPEVLWSCTTCGACVEQCPVDIEHVDHVLDLRRHQVLMEAEFPAELGGLFRNLERAGNPWGVNAARRLDWAQGLPFPVRQVGPDLDAAGPVEWLLWVGCAGAFDERAKQTTRAVAELLHTADVGFAVLGSGETCTGDPARRAGNEFLYQQLAAANVEALRAAGATKVVATCAHCFNTLRNEYAQLGLRLEVVHHTQLLNRLVRDGRLTPAAPSGAAPGGQAEPARPVTYHDPCYLGRHNGVYEPPRELIGALPDVELREMTRSGERSFCCGAGGARMWMEERIGKRINTERTEEALLTGAERVAVGCPFCRTMLADGVTAAQADPRTAELAEGVEVLDVAQLLLEAVRRGQRADGEGTAGG